MKRTDLLFGFLLAFLLLTQLLLSQTYNLQFVVVQNNGSNYDVKMQINGSAAFGNGGGNICFNYDTLSISSPAILTAHNFNSGLYQPINLTIPLPGVLSVNIEYNGTSGNGTAVSTTPSWTDVLTIRFTTVNQNGSSNLTFRDDAAPLSPTVLFDDAFNQLTGGTFTDLNTTPLPVQLQSFTARMVGGQVLLQWKTLSELNNLGFRVQRSGDHATQMWEDRGFVRGAGSTDRPNAYAFSDALGSANTVFYYRLLQQNRDGSEVPYPPISVYAENGANSFTILGVYPNPVRDRFSVAMRLPAAAQIEVQVVDERGVAVTLSSVSSLGAGRSEVFLSSHSLPSGRYWVRLIAEGNETLAPFNVLR